MCTVCYIENRRRSEFFSAVCSGSIDLGGYRDRLEMLAGAVSIVKFDIHGPLYWRGLTFTQNLAGHTMAEIEYEYD
jgi:hypothetical protein